MPDVFGAVGEAMNTDIRKTGCCVNCDAELYEIRQVRTDGPYAGHPSRLGPPLDGGLATTFLLMDGTLCDLSLCDECGPVAEYILPQIWRKVMNSMVYEQEHGGKGDYRKLNLHLAANPPVGILYSRALKHKWRDRVV